MIHLTRRFPGRSHRSTVVATAGALVLAVMAPHQTPTAQAIGVSVQIDPPSSYEGQTTCTKAPRPGTVALAAWLQRTYPATGSLGMMRPCRTGGISEHKDGRAFDWAADVRKPAAKRAAYDFITKALATDAAGNPHALARRLGIMYLIYNDTIWASYRDFAPRPYLNAGCKTLKRCPRTLRHKNHVHISLGYSGAAAQTSWYRARGVRSIPVLFPGSTDLDPNDTAVTGLTVPATGTTVTSSYTLRAGVTYRFVVTGTLTYASGGTGDASCVAGAPDWVPTDQVPLDPVPAWPGGSRLADWPGGPPGTGSAGSTHEDSAASLATPTTHGLTLAGALRWGTQCRPDHTYEGWYTAPVAQKVALRYIGSTPGASAGSLSVYVARDDIAAASLTRR